MGLGVPGNRTICARIAKLRPLFFPGKRGGDDRTAILQQLGETSPSPDPSTVLRPQGVSRDGNGDEHTPFLSRRCGYLFFPRAAVLVLFQSWKFSSELSYLYLPILNCRLPGRENNSQIKFLEKTGVSHLRAHMCTKKMRLAQ